MLFQTRTRDPEQKITVVMILFSVLSLFHVCLDHELMYKSVFLSHNASDEQRQASCEKCKALKVSLWTLIASTHNLLSFMAFYKTYSVVNTTAIWASSLNRHSLNTFIRCIMGCFKTLVKEDHVWWWALFVVSNLYNICL